MVSIQASFEIADDMLQEATRERLNSHGPIHLESSGRIGPIVEMVLASTRFERQYQKVSVDCRFSVGLREAIISGLPFGNEFSDSVGAFPLGLKNPVTSADSLWDQWTTHAENIAIAKGLNNRLVAGLLGAMVEIQDNVYEHSGAPQTGLIAYAATSKSFEFVVADRGIGVLQSLRQNPRYAEIADSGAALQEVIKEGVSRFPSETGRGQGFNQLFRALVGQNAELRFRSGDHALTLRPTDNALYGATILAQVAPLDGLSISIFCNADCSY